jgi:hypothetical protein
MYRR